jgi:hypothetical protein
VRLAIRKYTDPTQATSALGFRCAASLAPGLDAARWIIPDFAPGVLASDAAWDPTAAVALRRWESDTGQAGVAGYRVITRYEHVLVCPIASTTAATLAEVSALTERSRPLVLAFFSVPWPLSTPQLDAGDYILAWRAAGETSGSDTRARDAAYDESSLEDVPGFRADQDCFLVCDRNGTPLAALPAPPVTIGRAKPNRILLEPAVAAPPAEVPAETPAATTPATTRDTVRFHICIPSSRTNSKGVFFELALTLAGRCGSGWN